MPNTNREDSCLDCLQILSLIEQMLNILCLIPMSSFFDVGDLDNLYNVLFMCWTESLIVDMHLKGVFMTDRVIQAHQILIVHVQASALMWEILGKADMFVCFIPVQVIFGGGMLMCTS